MSYQVPQTRIFTQYEESTAVSVSSLAACIVAPYYDVHDKITFGSYESAAVSFPYIGLSGDDRITSADIADGVFKTTISNAQVQGYKPITYSTTEGNAGYIGADNKSLTCGIVVANGGGFSVPAGFPALKVGDTVVQKASGGSTKAVCKIAGFQQANATTKTLGLPIFNTYSEHAAGDLTLGGTPTITANAVVKIKITVGGTVAASNSPIRADISLDDATPIVTNATVGTSAITITGTGLTVTFTASKAWVAGDEISFGVFIGASATYQYDQGYSVVILDRTVTAATGDTFTLYYSAGDINDPVGATWDTEGLTLAASLTKNGLSIYSGDVLGTYRIRKNEYTDRVYSVSSTAELSGLVGTIHPLNPLSIMCYLALVNSSNSNVCFVAVADDSYASYSKAFDVLGTTNEGWAIVPYSENPTIQELAFTKAQEYCGAAIMNWKTAWLGYDVADTLTVMEGVAGTVVSPGDKITVDATYDITVVKYGDKIIKDGNTYTVLSVVTSTATPYIIIDTTLPTGAISGLTIIRPVSAQDKVDLYRTYARSFNSELVRVFFADAPYLTSWPTEKCPMTYLAAAWAGKRSGVAPHQSLTRSTITGITCKNTSGFTAEQMNQMAEYGVWITVTDNNGSTFCRHQLTTKDTGENYNLKEDSKVANAHEISMAFRSGLDSYYGRANVTETAMEVIRLKAEEIALSIQGRSWSALLGPQITSVNSISIEMDPNFSDRVNLYISLGTPDPLNNLDVYLTIA